MLKYRIIDVPDISHVAERTDPQIPVSMLGVGHHDLPTFDLCVDRLSHQVTMVTVGCVGQPVGAQT